MRKVRHTVLVFILLSSPLLPILTSKRFAHPAKIPSVTTSPKEEAMGQAMLSVRPTSQYSHTTAAMLDTYQDQS